MLIPTRFAYAIPDGVSPAAAALVEPGGNSLRAVQAVNIVAGQKLLVLGSGTIGLLATQFALAEGAQVHVGGVRADSLELVRSLSVRHTWTLDQLGDGRESEFDAVIEATSIPAMPSLAVRLTKPAGRVAFIGLASTPSLLDTRDVALKDVAAVGILSASPGLAGPSSGSQVAPSYLMLLSVRSFPWTRCQPGLRGGVGRLQGLDRKFRWIRGCDSQ